MLATTGTPRARASSINEMALVQVAHGGHEGTVLALAPARRAGGRCCG